MQTYTHLCPDLQRHVREFIPIHERFGISRKTVISFCDASKKDWYYSEIRSCPRGWKKGTRFFYYRRSRQNYEWIIQPGRDLEMWTIVVFGQYEVSKHDHAVFEAVSRHMSNYDMEILDVYNFSHSCEIYVRRDAQRSRQGMLDHLTSIVTTHLVPFVFQMESMQKSKKM